MTEQFTQQQDNMGERSSKVFSGEGIYGANKEIYGQTAEFFANEIRKRLPKREEPYVLADVGSFQGELMTELLRKMPDYRFKTIAIDKNGATLNNNKTAKQKLVADAEKIPLTDKSVDLVIVRYVLQWNDAEKQKKILGEIARIVKEFALIEHVGADVVDTGDWRRNIERLFSGSEVPKMKRSEHFFSSRDEVESWLHNMGIPFERLRDRVVNNAADIYIERFGLSTSEAEKTRKILADKNYFQLTDWVIYPCNRN